MGKWKNGDYSLGERLNEFCKDYISKYISIVTVETPVDSVIKAKRVASTTFNDQLAVIGGTLGLFTGISILSMVQVVCFLLTITKRMCHLGSKQCLKQKLVDGEKSDEGWINEEKIDKENIDEGRIDNENIDGKKLDDENNDGKKIDDRGNEIFVVKFVDETIKKAIMKATKKDENNVQRHGRRSVEKLDEEKPKWRI